MPLPESQRGLPLQDPASTARMPLTVVLVETATGVITVVRRLTVSPVFAAALHATLGAQAQQAWSPLRYKAACTMAYDRYPTGAAMAAGRTVPHARAGLGRSTTMVYPLMVPEGWKLQPESPDERKRARRRALAAQGE